MTTLDPHYLIPFAGRWFLVPEFRIHTIEAFLAGIAEADSDTQTAELSRYNHYLVEPHKLRITSFDR